MNENQNEDMEIPKAQIALDPDYIRHDEDFQGLDEDIPGEGISLDVLRSQKALMIFGGVGIVLLIVIIALFLGGGDDSIIEELNPVVARIEQLEMRLTHLEGMQDRFARLEKQDNELEQFIKEMDRNERSMEKKLDKITKDFARLQKPEAPVRVKTKARRVTPRKPLKTEAPRITPKEPVKAQAPPATPKESKKAEVKPVTPGEGMKVEGPPPASTEPIAPLQAKYYEVRSGDTLYRIALKNRLSVAELCRINNISPNTVIHAGQKLLVSPETGQ
jgi:LysM repeat protein